MEEKKPTRYYSDLQEKYVAKLLGGYKNANSGAGHFSKGDIFIDKASMLVECKTATKSKDSFSIKKEWIEKNRQEKFGMRAVNDCICFNFGPNEENFFIIDEDLMIYLINKLEEEYK